MWSKLGDDTGVRRETPEDGRPVAAHLVGRLDRHAHLRFQRRRAAIPEELLAPGEIPQGRRIAPQRLPREGAGLPAPIRESKCGPMATGTPVPPGAGQPRIGEQLCAERNRFGRQRIVGRRRRRIGTLEYVGHKAAVSGAWAAKECEKAQERRQTNDAKSGVPGRHVLSPVPPTVVPIAGLSCLETAGQLIAPLEAVSSRRLSPESSPTQTLEQIDRWIPGTRPGMTKPQAFAVWTSSAERRATGFSWIGQLSNAASTPSAIEIHHMAS